ncbi:TPA: DUF4145 domain-containing protein [Salmonella enterica subsp. salamae serovar 16:m,t:e,n,x]|uniref:DUF4145 domain-containing protein n=1 Tax=Salmonella enterica TaxID=28901 RepID=UPI00315F5B5B|nr:DUF4145 domain-containing protein [Salmonella enterica subsp. salamae serovar 16:m,t:e,n,x]
MDRKKLTSYFSLNERVPWLCPTCKSGMLEIIKPSLHKKITKQSHNILAGYNGQWIPEEVEYRYSCLFRCGNNSCDEVISSSGVGYISIVGYEYNENEEYQNPVYDDHFYPKYFEPALNLVLIPDNCPASIQEPLKESFKLFFSSFGAAANNIRVAIEAFLTELKVPTEKNRKDGSLTFMSLHERINNIPQAYIEYKEMLKAIKWIGNSGSHNSNVKPKVEDVIDAYDLIEHILEDVYAPRRKRLSAIAARINNNKGPGK